MAKPDPIHRKPWRWCRYSFRALRIALLSGIFLLLACLTWLRFVGLPDYLRLQVVDELARRGIVANFRSLHFHWFRGLVAEDLRVAWGGTNNPGVAIQLAEADLDVSPPLAWLRQSRLVRGFSVRRGSASIPLLVSNEPPLQLRIDDITAQVRFQEGDHWEIPRLAARLEGLQFELSAQITNTAALRRPGVGSAQDPGARERTLRLIRGFVRELQSFTNAHAGRIAVHLNLDGERIPATHGDLFVEVPSAKTVHGNLLNLRFSTRVHPPSGPDLPSQASVVLELDEVQTGHGGLSQLAIRAQLTSTSLPFVFTNATWEARADHIFLRGLRARSVALSGTTRIPEVPNLREALFDSLLQGHAGRLEIASGNPDPLTIGAPSFAFHLLATPGWTLPAKLDGTLSAGSVTDPRGQTGPARVQFDLVGVPSSDAKPPPPDVAFWSKAWPLAGRVDVELDGIRSDRVSIDHVHAVVDWNAPKLAVREIDAELYGGRLRVRGDLDVASRVATVGAESSFDPHGFDSLLGPRSLENILRYQWSSPPRIEAQARITLPPWGAKDVDWEQSVRPTVRVDGTVQVGAGSFKGIPFDEAVTSVSYDGAAWRLPDLRTSRPEGRQEISIEFSEATREYRIEGRGRVMPPVLKPVLGEQSGEIVDLFEFLNPVDAVVSVWGPWTEGTRQAILGTIVATNFNFRSQHFDRLEARVGYTNRFLVASPVRLTRGAGEAVAEGVGYDFADGRLWLTNAVNTIDPLVAAAAISPSFPEKIVPYQFATPPRVRANGTLRPKDSESADLTLSIQGGPFEFWRLKAEAIETDLLWKGSTLTLTNLSGRFFDGTLAGNAFFDLANPDDGLYRFEARIRQAELGKLLHHATEGRTNIASGLLDLDLHVHSARTSDIHSWNGAGRASLADGLLWDAPIFGFVSPVLNAVSPGLGNNRARAADATFTLEDSVIHTRDFTIDCPPAKLFYRGQLDFNQNVSAKVEAQILGNFTPMGPLFGLILRPLTKLFEFRISGTLSDVAAEPLYIPKFLLLPLQPLRLLFGLFGPGHGSSHGDPIHSQPEIPVPPEPSPTDPAPALEPRAPSASPTPAPVGETGIESPTPPKNGSRPAP